MKACLEGLFWAVLIVSLCFWQQSIGYDKAKRDLFKSCVINNEMVADGIRFKCFKCPSKGENNDKK